jgi:hypothetical protein
MAAVLAVRRAYHLVHGKLGDRVARRGSVRQQIVSYRRRKSSREPVYLRWCRVIAVYGMTMQNVQHGQHAFFLEDVAFNALLARDYFVEGK